MAAPLRLSGAPVLREILPGVLLASLVGAAALVIEKLIRAGTNGSFALPAIVIALLIGIAAYGIGNREIFRAGIAFSVKVLLRYAIGLLGLRVALGDIAALGMGTAMLVIGSMIITLIAGILFARLLGLSAHYGALSGAANAICGASATLATAAALPDYRHKGADIAFTVVMANAASTLVMLAYPPLCLLLGFSPRETGILLGLTIHDMAQVVGAGYAVSEESGNIAVIVKLFRVFLLLPAVMIIGWWFHRGNGADTARPALPGFALGFLALALINSLLPGTTLAPFYTPARSALIELSGLMMLQAIAALGLGTSLAMLFAVGWRHMAVFCGATILLLGVAAGGVFLLR